MLEIDVYKNLNKDIIKPVYFNSNPVDEFSENYKYNEKNEIFKFFGIKNFDFENDSNLIKKHLENKDYKELIKIILKLDSYELKMISKLNKNLLENNDSNKLFYFVKRFISNSILLDCEELYEILNSSKDKKNKLIKSIRIIIQNLENNKLFYFYFYNKYKINLNTFLDKHLFSPKDQSNLIVDFLKSILISNRKNNIFLNREKNKQIFNGVVENSGEDFNLENRELLKIWFIETSKADFIYLHKKIEKELEENLDELFNNFNKEDKYLIDSLIYYIENKGIYYCLEIKEGIKNNDSFVILRSLINIFKEKIFDEVNIIYKQLYEKDLIELFKNDEEFSFIINELINNK